MRKVEEMTADEFRNLKKPQKQNKYRNQRAQVGDKTFDSTKEARHYNGLCSMKLAGKVVSIELQVRFPLEVNGHKIGVYVADFVVKFADGRTEVQDVKGVKTPVYKLKKRLMKAIHNIEIVEK